MFGQAVLAAGAAGQGRYEVPSRLLEFITDREIYERVICDLVPRAGKFLWLATADLKDLHVDKGRRMVPFLEVLSELVRRKVEIRLLHAKAPGPVFRRDYEKYANLAKGMEMMLCPRVHVKAVIVDGRWAYTGSANLTGAGVGAKNRNRRNFESGILTDERRLVAGIMGQFDGIWRGSHCGECRRKEFCADHKEISGR